MWRCERWEVRGVTRYSLALFDSRFVYISWNCQLSSVNCNFTIKRKRPWFILLVQFVVSVLLLPLHWSRVLVLCLYHSQNDQMREPNMDLDFESLYTTQSLVNDWLLIGIIHLFYILRCRLSFLDLVNVVVVMVVVCSFTCHCQLLLE